MKRSLFVVLMLVVLVGVLSVSVASAQSGGARSYIVVANSKSGIPSGLAAQIRAAGGTITQNISQLGVVVVTSANPRFESSIVGVQGVAPVRRMQAIEPTHLESLTINANAGNPPNSGEDDGFFDFQWGADAVNAPEAWARGLRGDGVTIAILDEGIDRKNPDLAPNLNESLSRSFVPGEDWWAIFEGSYFNHGTHVAGIAAAADNGWGVIGMAPEANLISVKVLSEELGFGEDAWILAGIKYAADVGAKVINMSLGSGPLDTRGGCDSFGCYTAEDVATWFEAYTRATFYANQRGVTVIASSGNDAFDFTANPQFIHLPSDAVGVISISATAPLGWAVDPENAFLDYPTSYTNYGRERIDFAAPGGDTAYPGNENCTIGQGDYERTRPCWVFDLVFSNGVCDAATQECAFYWAGGTSMAAPHAAGIAANYIAHFGGHLRPDQVFAYLRQGADYVSGSKDEFYGHGRVTAYPSSLIP